jgi:uncharacterized membrane protein
MTGYALTLHMLAAIVWVGGMFFAYLAARPALAELDLPLRARAWARIFRRFFPWVWAAIAALLGTGVYLVYAMFEGFALMPTFVGVMMGLGILMMVLFAHLFFGPYRRLQKALESNNMDLAKAAMGHIRLIMAFNLSLGLIVVLIATLGMFSAVN